MAAFRITILSFLVSSLFLVVQPCLLQLKSCSYTSIYQFGDSISDVGNLIREGSGGTFSKLVAHLPYGETYFNESTGRSSNGLLMIDFFANALGLPFLNAYLDKDATFDHGVDFAVAGATALDYSFFANRNIRLEETKSSLSIQLDWFMTHLKTICHTKSECAKKLEKALFLMGEIGGNDYSYALTQGKTIEEVRTYVPRIVNTIKNAIKKVIGVGALHVVVPGNFPIGCMPIYLTAFKSSYPSAYDKELGCLHALNSFSRFHNKQLQKALEELRQEHPQVVILYADYYHTYLALLRNANFLGFEKESILKACCGRGGDYNFNALKMCGSEGVSACPNPEQRVSWDGIHLTQKAYEYMSQWLVHWNASSYFPMLIDQVR